MPRLDFAIMMVAGTLAIVGLFVLAFFAIRDRLAADPDLQEFMRRVEEGREAKEHGPVDTAGDETLDDQDSDEGSSA